MIWAQMGGGFGPGGGMVGHGMMGRYWADSGGASGWHSTRFSVSGLTLTKGKAAQIAQAHLQALADPNLKLGDLAGFEPYYEVAVVTKDRSLVEKLLVDKRTGWLRSVY